DKFVGVGGLVLLCLFIFPWFNWVMESLVISDLSGTRNPQNTLTVWEGFPFFSYIFLLTGLISIGFVLFKLIKSKNIPIAIGYVIMALSLVTASVILYNIIIPPTEVDRGRIVLMTVTVTPAISLFAALLAALSILLGGLLSVRRAKG
ncbi:hypothetical protein MUO66_06720, partial [Candidatus Bathyarchaeota archaeon]|nr:hypothetical protein [Candidatus Bathyarchaeota archaeon]